MAELQRAVSNSTDEWPADQATRLFPSGQCVSSLLHSVLKSDFCFQGAGQYVGDAAAPFEAFISLADLGNDQLNTALSLVLSFSDGTTRTVCYTALSIGIATKQCPSDCNQCTPTYQLLRLQPYALGSLTSGSCPTCKA